MFAEQGVDLGGLGLRLEGRATMGVQQGDGRGLGVLVQNHLAVGLDFELEGRADYAVSHEFADIAVFGGGVHIVFFGLVEVAGCIDDNVHTEAVVKIIFNLFLVNICSPANPLHRHCQPSGLGLCKTRARTSEAFGVSKHQATRVGRGQPNNKLNALPKTTLSEKNENKSWTFVRPFILLFM